MFEIGNKINNAFDELHAEVVGKKVFNMESLDDLRCLSVRWPWAPLIIIGGSNKEGMVFKNIENRSYMTKYRGPLLIQVSKTYTIRNYNDKIKLYEKLKINLPIHYYMSGKIIGMVDLVDCVSSKDAKEKFKDNIWYEHGKCAWILENPKAFQKNVLHRGRPSLFPVKENKEEILEQIKIIERNRDV